MGSVDAKNGLKNINVLKKIQENPENFSFPQAVNISLKICGSSKKFQIKSNFSMSPKSNAVHSVKISNHKVVMFVNFLNLSGAHGPLPIFFSEKIIEESRSKNTKLYDFLNIFHHRIAFIHFKSLKMSYPSIGYDDISESKYGIILNYISGGNLHEISKKTGIPFNRLIGFSSMFFKKDKTIKKLNKIINLIPDINISVKEISGGWIVGDICEQSSLGNKFSILGKNFLLGRRQWISEKTITIIVDSLEKDKLNLIKNMINEYMGDVEIKVLIDEKISKKNKFKIGSRLPLTLNG